MAVLSNTSPLFGVTGLIGNLVFRTIHGQTVISAYQPPRKRRHKKVSELQQLTRSTFAEASKYAKGITRDPVKYEKYKRKAKKMGLSSAYTAAVTEYMRKVKIGQIDTWNMAEKGEAIIQSAKGHAAFTKVEIRLVTLTGQILANGSAVSLGNGNWRYRYSGPPLDWLNVYVEAEATDALGNTSLNSARAAYSYWQK